MNSQILLGEYSIDKNDDRNQLQGSGNQLFDETLGIENNSSKDIPSSQKLLSVKNSKIKREVSIVDKILTSVRKLSVIGDDYRPSSKPAAASHPALLWQGTSGKRRSISLIGRIKSAIKSPNNERPICLHNAIVISDYPKSTLKGILKKQNTGAIQSDARPNIPYKSYPLKPEITLGTSVSDNISISEYTQSIQKGSEDVWALSKVKFSEKVVDIQQEMEVRNFKPMESLRNFFG